MELADQVKEILLKNHDLRKFKNDQSIKSNCTRIIHLFVAYELYKLDAEGNIMGKIPRSLDSLTNFELLHLIESIISTNYKMLMDPFLTKSIQSIDSAKCWYYPKELSILIFEATEKRHNYRKIKAILNKLVDQNVCLKVTNKKRQSMYRIMFTYSD